jgi:hypothetical protein
MMTVGLSYSETSDMICHTNQLSCENCSGWFPDDILGSSNFYDDTIKIEKFSVIFRSTISIRFSDPSVSDKEDERPSDGLLFDVSIAYR